MIATIIPFPVKPRPRPLSDRDEAVEKIVREEHEARAEQARLDAMTPEARSEHLSQNLRANLGAIEGLRPHCTSLIAG